MKIDDLARRPSAWLQGEGKDSDVVISSRVRLARNLNGYSFVGRATDLDLENLMTSVCGTFAELFDASKVTFVDFSDLPDDDAQFLFERRLVNREFLDSKRPRGLLFDNQEQFSVMVNEEDHLRLQAITPGFELETAYERVNSLDDRLESKLDYSFDDQYGYLTASPSNLGTGLRATVLLHLPGLVYTRNINNIINISQQLGLSVRGLYGEGSESTARNHSRRRELRASGAQNASDDQQPRTSRPMSTRARRPSRGANDDARRSDDVPLRRPSRTGSRTFGQFGDPFSRRAFALYSAGEFIATFRQRV